MEILKRKENDGLHLKNRLFCCCSSETGYYIVGQGALNSLCCPGWLQTCKNPLSQPLNVFQMIYVC